MKVALRFAVMMPAVLGLAGCLNILGGDSADSVPPAARQLPASTQALLSIKGMTQEAPIFIRIFKEESELEVWKLKNGRFELFRTYAICAWSGGLGPKVQQGDRQAPEGFYTIGPGQLNPHSLYHLAFNIGFPNAYDRANNHTGSALMIHGDCKSAGCYAMTDAYIEEIYILAREALAAGQTRFHVHAYPFRLTDRNMRAHHDSPWYSFWTRMKEGYDYFEATGRLPVVKVCSKQYLVNVQFTGQPTDPAPDAACPLYSKIDPAQSPSMDGISPTLFAGLKKPEMSPVPVPAVAIASQTPAAPAPVPQAKPQPAVSVASASADMSASPVITRTAETQPQGRTAPASIATASMISAKPTQTAPVSRTFASAASTAPVLPVVTSPATTTSQPAQQAWAPQPQAGVQSSQQAAAVDDAPSKYVAPDAIQKPNRSGKGGKLTATAAAPTDDASQSSGTGQAPAAQSYGFNGPVR